MNDETAKITDCFIIVLWKYNNASTKLHTKCGFSSSVVVSQNIEIYMQK